MSRAGLHLAAVELACLVALDRPDPENLYYLALMLAQVGCSKEALQLLRLALKQQPEDDRCHILNRRVEQSLGECSAEESSRIHKARHVREATVRYLTSRFGVGRDAVVDEYLSENELGFDGRSRSGAQRSRFFLSIPGLAHGFVVYVYEEHDHNSATEDVDIAIRLHEGGVTMAVEPGTVETFEDYCFVLAKHKGDEEGRDAAAFIYNPKHSKTWCEAARAAISDAASALGIAIPSLSRFDESRGEPDNKGKGAADRIRPEENVLQKTLEQLTGEDLSFSQKLGLCRKSLALLSKKKHPRLWATCLAELGGLLLTQQHDDKLASVEEAIDCLSRSLYTITESEEPQKWSGIQMSLGNAYAIRVSGERDENVEKAIAAIENALRVRCRDQFRADWALGQKNLGILYGERNFGDSAENIERAIAATELAVNHLCKQYQPEAWAMAIGNLGALLLKRRLGRAAENNKRAIVVLKTALKECSEEETPDAWARMHYILGVALGKRKTDRRAEGVIQKTLKRIVNAHECALRVYSEESHPLNWAMCHFGIGEAYVDFECNGPSEIESAIASLELSLCVISSETNPYEWAQAHRYLAWAFYRRATGDRPDNVERVVQECRLALQVFKYAAFPFEWSQVNSLLGDALAKRERGKPADNLDQAIVAYEAALQVRREFTPENCAIIRSNLGNCYRLRVRGIRTENLRKAVDVLDDARKELRPEKAPGVWGAIHYNLGLTHAQIGAQHNLLLAKRALESALLVYVPTDFPKERSITLELYNQVLADLDAIGSTE